MQTLILMCISFHCTDIGSLHLKPLQVFITDVFLFNIHLYMIQRHCVYIMYTHRVKLEVHITATHRTSLKHISIVSGALHGIQWITESGRPCLFLNMYLDATSDVSIKLSQLRAGSTWARSNLPPETTVFGGGDRNHIRYPHERMHSEAGHRCGRPNHQLNQTFDDFCAAFNHCSILDQPDFTMVRKDNDHVMCSVLDVMFTNVDMLTEPLSFPVSCRVPTPDSESRDHSPVALKWVVASRE